uniref:SH3 domain-binding protein 5 n=1 Tax=Jaculus jaculus TaxID=51337 RepID=A0A8C5NZM0_JACJA
MDAALKRSRAEEPAELLPPARDVEEEEEGGEEEGMEQGLEEEEEVDPRIQGELEKLNQSTDDINRRETELEVQSAGLSLGTNVVVSVTFDTRLVNFVLIA